MLFDLFEEGTGKKLPQNPPLGCKKPPLAAVVQYFSLFAQHVLHRMLSVGHDAMEYHDASSAELPLALAPPPPPPLLLVLAPLLMLKPLHDLSILQYHNLQISSPSEPSRMLSIHHSGRNVHHLHERQGRYWPPALALACRKQHRRSHGFTISYRGYVWVVY